MISSSESTYLVVAYAGNSARVVSARALTGATDSTHRTTVLLCTPGNHVKSQIQSTHEDSFEHNSERRERRHGEQNKIESMLISGEGKKSSFARDSALGQSRDVS